MVGTLEDVDVPFEHFSAVQLGFLAIRSTTLGRVERSRNKIRYLTCERTNRPPHIQTMRCLLAPRTSAAGQIRKIWQIRQFEQVEQVG